MRTTSPDSILAFLGVQVPLVDQILEHLRDITRLPGRCFVFSSDVQLLGVLVKQWEGEVEIVVCVAHLPVADMLDAIDLIAAREGLTPEDVLWVGGESDLGHVPRNWRRLAFNEPAGAKAVAQAVARELTH